MWQFQFQRLLAARKSRLKRWRLKAECDTDTDPVTRSETDGTKKKKKKRLGLHAVGASSSFHHLLSILGIRITEFKLFGTNFWLNFTYLKKEIYIYWNEKSKYECIPRKKENKVWKWIRMENIYFQMANIYFQTNIPLSGGNCNIRMLILCTQTKHSFSQVVPKSLYMIATVQWLLDYAVSMDYITLWCTLCH